MRTRWSGTAYNFGVPSPKIREKLINVGRDFTLDNAIEIGQNFEYFRKQLKSMGNNSPEVHAIHTNRRPASGPEHGASRHNPSKANPGSTQQKFRGQRKKRFQQRSTKSANEKCGNCGRLHDEQQTCPAKGKRCDTCNRWNHFAAMCRSTLNVNEVTTQPDQGGGVESDDDFL